MKNILKISVVFIVFSLLISCEKEHSKSVVYKISKNESGFSVQYRDVNGQLQKENIDLASKEDIWKYTFDADQGDILYLAAGYKDINSSCKVEILIDGKSYKQGYSSGDTVNYLIVSGTIPLD
ncbi:hypothetical protein ACFLRY_00150 [Bacteroidota bacterium]